MLTPVGVKLSPGRGLCVHFIWYPWNLMISTSWGIFLDMTDQHSMRSHVKSGLRSGYLHQNEAWIDYIIWLVDSVSIQAERGEIMTPLCKTWQSNSYRIVCIALTRIHAAFLADWHRWYSIPWILIADYKTTCLAAGQARAVLICMSCPLGACNNSLIIPSSFDLMRQTGGTWGRTSGWMGWTGELVWLVLLKSLQFILFNLCFLYWG